MLEQVDCPYCGESFETAVDHSGGMQCLEVLKPLIPHAVRVLRGEAAGHTEARRTSQAETDTGS